MCFIIVGFTTWHHIIYFYLWMLHREQNKMVSLILKVPNLRCFSVSATSNGAPLVASSQSGGPVILKLPLDEIRRPLMRTRANDPSKVKELTYSIREIGPQVPISLVVINMRLTSALGSQPYAAKLEVEQKKCSGVIYAKVIFPFWNAFAAALIPYILYESPANDV